eukprot:5296028-Amphidinium_carterae.1
MALLKAISETRESSEAPGASPRPSRPVHMSHDVLQSNNFERMPRQVKAQRVKLYHCSLRAAIYLYYYLKA